MKTQEEYELDFLSRLDKIKVKELYVKIILLTFDEKPIREIQGRAQSGSININGTSRVRRTLNLTMFADGVSNNLEDLDNDISLNKKFKIFIGYKNPFVDTYDDYGEIVWFKGGHYVISTATLSATTTGCNITISAKDYMVFLDGTVGGILPASTTFHERYEYQINGDIKITYPTIYQIIREAVHHIGEIPDEKIYIYNLEETVKLLIKYTGDKPMWVKGIQASSELGSSGMNYDLTKDYVSFHIGDKAPNEQFQIIKEQNDDVGYMLTDFTYPGELILSAGETVMAVLDKICTVLGNYEYFFDLDGNFVFQEIKNYLNKSYDVFENESVNYYPTLSHVNTKHKYALTDLTTTSSISVDPKYDGIKNDFIVWGTRKTAEGAEIGIRYHLAIDEKPKKSDLWEKNYPRVEISKLNKATQKHDVLTTVWVYADDKNYLDNKDSDQTVIEYLQAHINDAIAKECVLPSAIMDYINVRVDNDAEARIAAKKDELKVNTLPKNDLKEIYQELYSQFKVRLVDQTMPDVPFEWREEMYRAALERQYAGTASLFYDEELLAEWRQLYNPNKEEWAKWNYWNPNVFSNPGVLNFWLDFIDSGELANYSVNKIGRRTKVVNDNSVRSVFNRDIMDVVFLVNPIVGSTPEEKKQQLQELSDQISKFNKEGQKYCIITENQEMYFATSSTYTSCYDMIRELLYQSIVYNTSVNITCQPMMYLEPNNLIYLENKRTGVIGNYLITQFTIPLSYNGNMTIQASKALSRI